MKLHLVATLLRSFTDAQSGRMQKKGCKKPPQTWDAKLPQGCGGAPQIHAAIQEVNKLKERQKEGGWPLINRRSHAPRRAFPSYLCHYCYFGHFLVVIGWDSDGQVPTGGGGTCRPLVILEWRHALDKAYLSLCACVHDFPLFPATYWSHSREDIPGRVILKKNPTHSRDGCWWRGGERG